MSDDVSQLRQRIKDLEAQVKSQAEELHKYRSQITETNHHLEKIIGQVNSEVLMALQLQRLLSPTEIPSIHGFDFSTKFQPGSSVGGDYFDIFEHADKMKFGVLLSSCSGYAMSALFLSLLIKFSSQMESRRGLAPHEMILELSKAMIPQIQAQDKASLFYGVVDKRTYELQYCSVGQIPAYLQVHGQETLVTLEACGPRLSKEFNTEPRSLTLQLNPRDRWILCSEGVVQAKNSKGENFGPERLRDTIRSAPRAGVHELRNEVLFQTEKFTQQTEPHRDQTVLVVEVKDRVIKLARQ